MSLKTKMLILIILALIPLRVCQAESGPDQDIVFQRQYFELLGDQYYQTRDVPGHLESAIESYQKAIDLTHSTTTALWKIVRCYWILATSHTTDPEIRRKIYRTGMAFGNKAIEATPDNSNAFLWNALIHGNNALEQGVMNALYMRKKLKKWLERSLELDPQNLNALLGLAGWYYYVPEFFGGNISKTYQIIKKAEEIDPNYTTIFMHKAQYLIEEGRTAEARQALKTLVAIRQPRVRVEGMEERVEARKLLADMAKQR